MGNVLGKIPLLSEFAPGFKDAEEAARKAKFRIDDDYVPPP